MPTAREQVALEVAWPDATELDREVYAALPGRSQAVVLRSEIPVLVPSVAAANAVVMARPAWTAVSIKHDELTVSLHASRIAQRYGSIAPVTGPQRVRGADAFITQNERIWSAAWHEHGVAYALEVECDDPRDARCADPKMLQTFADDLRYVGGRPHARLLEVSP